MDLSNELKDQVFVERPNYAFFINITYEKISIFRFRFKTTRNTMANCKTVPFAESKIGGQNQRLGKKHSKKAGLDPMMKNMTKTELQM